MEASDSTTIFALVTTSFAIGSFVLIYIYKQYKGHALRSEDMIQVSLSASSIPTGFLLVGSAFDLSLITQFTGGLGVYLGVAGLIFLHTVGMRIRKSLRQNIDQK